MTIELSRVFFLNKLFSVGARLVIHAVSHVCTVTSSTLGPYVLRACKHLQSGVHRFLSQNNSDRGQLYFTPKRNDEMGGPCGSYGEERGVHRVLVRKPERKRPLGRSRRRWEDNIKMDLQEMGGGCGNWMELVQDRDRWRALVSTVMKLRVLKNAGNFLTSCRTN